MITISKSKLKTHMLRIFRELEQSGEEAIVTDRGNPVLRISPITSRKKSVKEMFGHLQGQVRYIGDPDEPTTDEWESV
jgi:antitoxin (DNA-binding transcriptional repressor) of toxin-antitoxin stability system